MWCILSYWVRHIKCTHQWHFALHTAYGPPSFYLWWQNTFKLLLLWILFLILLFSPIGQTKRYGQQKRKGMANKIEKVPPTPTVLDCWELTTVWPNIFNQQMIKTLVNTNILWLLGVKNCWAQHFWPTEEEQRFSMEMSQRWCTSCVVCLIVLSPDRCVLVIPCYVMSHGAQRRLVVHNAGQWCKI